MSSDNQRVSVSVCLARASCCVLLSESVYTALSDIAYYYMCKALSDIAYMSCSANKIDPVTLCAREACERERLTLW